MSNYDGDAGPRTEADSGGRGPAPGATDRTTDLAIDCAAEVIRLRRLIERILMYSDFTAAQQASILREARVSDE